jgi:hypothetical protein
MLPEDDLRRRQMMQQALTRGLQRPRAPLDERLPDGSSVGELLRKVDVPANAGLSIPQPTQPAINVSGIAPPQPNQPVTPLPTTPRIGYSTAGLTGVDRLIQRRRALEEADPESKVTDSGEILPPEKTGRLKGLGQGVALAASQYDPAHKLYGLGQAIGGGLGGAISPRSSAKSMRRFELGQLDNDLARGLKLEGAQVDLERARNPIGQMSTRVVGEGEYPGIDAGTEIRVRVDPRTGSITDVVGPNSKPVVADLAKRPAAGTPHYEKDADGYLITVQGGRARRVTGDDGQPVRVKSTDSNGEVVAVEVNGQTLKVTPGQALNYYGQVGERAAKRDDEQRERGAKLKAAEDDYASLLTEEQAALAEKNRAYGVLDQMRKSSGIPKEDVAQAEDAAKTADRNYQSYAEKKRDAQRRVAENQGSASSAAVQPYAGRTMSVANLAKYAKDKGISEDAARRQVEAQGVRVQ